MEGHNKKIVDDLYKALAAHDFKRVQCLLPPYIDWWFHGPLAHKYNLMQLLTGSCVLDDTDSFKPVVVVGVGSMVVAEGYHFHGNRKTCWVHAWTVENGSIITRVREYLNTSLTVFSFHKSIDVDAYLVSPLFPNCKNMWQSELADNASVPHLLLMI